MAPLRVSTTKSEWLPDDPTAFVPTRLWKLPFITTWDDSRNQNRPTDSAEEAQFFSTFASLYHTFADDIAAVPGLAEVAGQQSQLLLDRMLFLYFIQKKGWLNQQPDYLYRRFREHWRRDPSGSSYYSDV